MSGRFKRHLSKASTSTGEGGSGGNTSGAMARKKRRLDNVSSDDEERSFWTPKHLGDLKAYNRSASEAPAELFRKDLISAMKLADNEPLTSDDFWGITDQWKQEWERGVQVPVNPDSLPEPSVIRTKDYPRTSGDFRLPRRYIRVTHNDFFNNEKHVLSNLPTKAEKMCRYDMDNLDEAWLKAYNGERARMGAEPVPYHIFELIVEHLEETCWENIHKLLKTEETLAIEFDEDVICDVCRSPDREEGNEMVFCDICNICVHQACYGIMAIPSGSWLCRTCKLGIKPNCDLCPNKGGAMKSTKSGHKWAHVACALWIPEVSIGSVERMEPITKITNIPQSRWALVCVLCRERRGACIQCSVKSCKTAYHVTCAFKHGLEMKPIEDEENADNVKLRSYCEKHSRTGKKDSDGDSDGGGPNPPKKKQDINNEQKNKAKAAKLRQIESEFFKHVDVLQTSTYLDIDYETTETIFYYWKLKRRAGFNKPLLTPRCQELDLLSQQQEQDIERMKMFVQLRQYLERVRNLCYMVSRREKLSRSFLKTREQTFHKQVALLGNDSLNFAPKEAEAIAEANHGHCIYDRIYSHTRAPIHSVTQFESIMGLIANTYKDKAKVGSKAPQSKAREQASKKKGAPKDINGLLKSRKKPEPELFKNPYRKPYFNGAEERRSRSRSHSNCGSTETSSTEDSDSSLASTKWNPPDPGGHISVFTSSEDEKIFNKSTKFNNNNNIRSKTMFELPSSTKNKNLRDTIDEPTQKTVRGRGAGRRGRGRPPTIRGGLSRSATTALKRENAFFSSEEDKSLSPAKDSKMFDALIRTSTRSLRRDSSSSPIKKEPKPLADSSDEEGEKKQQLNRVVRGKGVRKSTRQEALSSSEEELPAPPKAPPKRGKGRGRGRGAPRKHSATTAPSSWSFLPKFSDEEDNLGPATYKLTSEEDEKSDKSMLEKEDFPSRLDILGGSSDNRSDASDSASPGKREAVRRISKRSDSEDNNESEEENKESGEESLSHLQLKTKAAMKEFTPKIEAKVEKLNRRRGDRSTKVLRGSSAVERIKAEPKTEVNDVNCGKESTKLGDSEPSHDLTLFVPQRAAAKKASELITSQNIGGATVNQTSCHLPMSQEPTTDKKQPLPKPGSDVVESESCLPLPDDPVKDKKFSSQRIRRGRSSKERQEDLKTETKSDTRDESASEPPKKNIFETPEILTYVPIREAARKAAENMKGSAKAGAGGAPLPSQGSEDLETVNPSTPTKPKKNQPKSDTKTLLLRSSKSKSPRNSVKVLDAGSESEEEAESASGIKRTGKESSGSSLRVDKNRSIFSESEDEILLTPKKEKVAPEKTPELGKELPNKQQLFRGDIFVRDHQSSSENDEDEKLKPSQGRESSVKVSKKEASEPPPLKEDRSKNHSFRSSRNLTRLFGSEGDLGEEEHEAENEEPPAETRRKAPDKKLKTSDGRPEHGFQPPVTPRDESRIPHDKPVGKVSGPNLPGEEGEQRVRESGVKCRSGTTTGDVPHKDVRSDPDAPLSIRKQRPSAEAVSDGGERELDGRSRRDGPEAHARGKENREKDPRNLQYQHQPSAGKVQPEETPISQQQQEQQKQPQQQLRQSEPQQHQKQQHQYQHQSKTPKATPEKRFKSTFECISSSVEEEATLIKKEPETGGCNNTSSKGSSNIFNFTEKDVEVERMEDIEENSDPEPDPKKVKITVIDDETDLISESKVELPKDSGYKSAMATPEPTDKAQSLCNDNESCQYNTVINDQIPADVSLSLKKTRLQQLNSPTQLKNNTTRYISPGRRKNLEDVIEERKKIAEQSEFEASLLLDKRTEASKPLSPQVPDPDSEPLYSEPTDGGRDGTRISQLPISGSTSTGSSVCSTSSAPSSFVEEWREQWEKSPTSQTVQMEHMEVPASYPPLGHPGLPLNDYPCPPYLDPTNPLSANLMLFSRLNMINSPLNQNMMQIAMLRQLRKSHDSPLEDESNLKVDISSRLLSRDDPRSFYGLGECDRNLRMLEHPPKAQISQHSAAKPSNVPSSESSERQLLENKELPQMAPVKTPQSTFIPNTSLEPLKVSYAVTSVVSSQSLPSFSQSSGLSEVRTEAPESVLVGLDHSKPVGELEPLQKLPCVPDSSKLIGDSLETAKAATAASESPKPVVAALETPKTIASVMEPPLVSVGAALEPSKSDNLNLEPVTPTVTKLEPARSIVTRSESSESIVTRLEPPKSVVNGLEPPKPTMEASEPTKPVEASLEPSKLTSANLKSPKPVKSETEKPAAGHSTLKTSSASESIIASVSHVVSSALTPTSTVTNSFSKLSSVPVVSSAAAATKKATSVLSSNLTDSKSTVKKVLSPTSVVSTKVTTTSSVSSIISSTHKTTTCDVSSLKMTSPIPSVLSPTPSTPGKGSSPNLVTVDTSALHSPPAKRIPIYMQDPKAPKPLEKRSPRAPATSPRWSNNKDKKERNTRASRSVRGKGGRGRGGGAKNKRKGSGLRYNSISVPKELVGTVYEFDDEFDDDGPANNALDDLRMLREKRQSVDTTPVLPPVSTPVSTPTSTPSSTPTQSQTQKQPPNLTPVYINETKDQPPKKRVKEKRIKPAHKDRTSKREEEDEVAKILKDYRNQQNSTLKSVHEPSPPQAVSPQDSKKGSNNNHHHSAHPSPAAGTHHLPEEDPLSLSDYKQPFSKVSASSADDRKKQDGAKGGTELLLLSSASYTATSVVSSLAEDRTNQLKLKIKGPYANSYLSSNLSNPPVEASVNPTPPSTTTTLRRMRKKELIMQYCSSVSSSSSTPPHQQQRTGITFPKAVASMTSVPTKEDYKMYTQDGTSSRGGNSTRRRRQPRELNQLDWTLLDDSKIKRNSESTTEGGRKRARAGKEVAKATTEESPGLHVTRTLRISLGKKGSSEVSEVTSVPPAESLKGKPPKKRHEDVFSQVKSDNLKFRREIMANFDKRGGGKTVTGEKKSRKRKFGFGDGSGGGGSPLNSEIKEENSTGSSNDAQPKRIVLKISKTKSESPGGSETEERHGGAGGSHTNPSQPIPHPLKIRLNLANLSKNDACSDASVVRKRDTESPRLSSGGDQILPLKIKLQRRPEGYVTSKSSSLDESCALDQGPGPPPEPPDPPLDPPAANPLRNDSPIEHKDREALPPAAAGPSAHSRISEDVIQRLEAQLAATDGPPSAPNPSSSPPPPVPQSSFSSLQPLPSLKDESGCR